MGSGPVHISGGSPEQLWPSPCDHKPAAAREKTAGSVDKPNKCWLSDLDSWAKQFHCEISPPVLSGQKALFLPLDGESYFVWMPHVKSPERIR